ncbi:hypothetical protein ACFVFQ_01745 [Streptomyces sp. NPDC057743]|uniref:hypothetical protein n=1 Tax=Streptomyces sp. NPDC057743 TaxID=3346236 RepID=UPI00368E1601
MARLHFIKDDGFARYKVPLTGGTPFVLYWDKGDQGIFYPVTFYGGGGSAGEDFAYYTKGQEGKGIPASAVLQLRFDTAEEHLTPESLAGKPLQYRNGRTGSWIRPYQRKGDYYYIAGSNSGENRMRSIKRAVVYEGDRIRFALRMDIEGKGDSWLSRDEHLGSIRMRDDEKLWGRLIAHRRGDVANDATGGINALYYPRSYGELTDGLILASQDIDPTGEENDPDDEESETE